MLNSHQKPSIFQHGIFKLITIVVLLLSFNFLRAQSTFKCDESRYRDSYGDDKIWNDMILKACNEINQGAYMNAYVTLKEAIKRDSIQSNGLTNAYIDGQFSKIQMLLEDRGELISTSKVTAKAPTVPIKEVASEAPKVDEKVAEENRKETPQENVEKISSDSKETTTNKEVTAQETQSNLVNASNVSADKKDKNHDDSSSSPSAIAEKTTINEDDKTIPSSNIGYKSFSSEELADFQKKGLQKVKQLEGYIQQIGSKQTSPSLALQASENALRLFDTEERRVQVSSLKNPNVTRVKIRQYLQKLRLLNYEEVNIEWADFLFTSDFIKGPDGNYYGYINFQQRFTAMLDNKIAYADVTTKKQQVILKYYEKAIEGAATVNWDVFLGDISVEQTTGK